MEPQGRDALPRDVERRLSDPNRDADSSDTAGTGAADIPDLDDGTTSEECSSDWTSSGALSLARGALVQPLAVSDDEQDTVQFGIPLDPGSLFSPSEHPAFSIFHGAGGGFYDDEDGEATLNSTRSLASSDVPYVWEHGRRYVGEYHIPNDTAEQTRWLLLHEVYLSAFDGELTSVPLEDPSHILDIGAGTGEWAEDMADCFPDAEVTGIDLADVFPKAVHPNVFFEVDDAEIEWERPDDHYDLVHFRNMIGAFCDWSFIYGQAFRVTKPGGWIELLDFDEYEGFGNFFSFFSPDSIIQKIGQDLKEAAQLSGRPRGVYHLEPRLLYDAGFEDVTVTEHAIPLSPKELSTGHLFLRSTTEAFEAVTLRLLTKYKGWAPEEVRFAKAVWQNEMMELMSDPEKASGFFIKLRVVTARKPAKPSSLGPAATLRDAIPDLEYAVAE